MFPPPCPAKLCSFCSNKAAGAEGGGVRAPWAGHARCGSGAGGSCWCECLSTVHAQWLCTAGGARLGCMGPDRGEEPTCTRDGGNHQRAGGLGPASSHVTHVCVCMGGARGMVCFATACCGGHDAAYRLCTGAWLCGRAGRVESPGGKREPGAVNRLDSVYGRSTRTCLASSEGARGHWGLCCCCCN